MESVQQSNILDKEVVRGSNPLWRFNQNRRMVSTANIFGSNPKDVGSNPTAPAKIKAKKGF